MKLSRKLMFIFLGIGLIPLLLASAYFTITASRSLEYQAFHQLESARSIKKAQIAGYFEERHADIKMLSEVLSALYSEHSKTSEVVGLLSNNDGQDYFKDFIESYGYYDLFIISPEGDVDYTVTKEADFGTNLVNGPYSNSGLAKAFRISRDSREYALQDFEQYAPSNNEPAAFLTHPVTLDGKLIAIVGLQVSIKHLNAIMQQREGMGKTGETYLVGNDFRMRSDSFLDPVNRSVNASFAGTIANNGIDSKSVREALAGKSGSIHIIDYNGNPVLSAYAPLKVGDHYWALIAEIDEAEAFAAVINMEIAAATLILIMVAVISGVAFAVARSVTRPLGGEPKDMQRIADSIADGNLTLELQEDNSGSVYDAMAKMNNKLRDMVGNMNHISDEMARSSEETSVITAQTQQNIEIQQNESAKIASAMMQMAATVQQVAGNAQEASEATDNANQEVVFAQQVIEQTRRSVEELADEVSRSNTAIEELEGYSNQIDSILSVISDIAEQTNLLALNAAIEAARAGDHGRGFAVVADEVRSLAKRTQDSTSDIERIISQLKQGTRDASASMHSSLKRTETSIEYSNKMASAITAIGSGAININEMTIQIASATEQQSGVADEINSNVDYIHKLALENAGGASQTAEATHSLAESAVELHALIAQFRT